jgi:hypothetical protein
MGYERIGGSREAINVNDPALRWSKKISKRHDILQRIDEDAKAVAHSLDPPPKTIGQAATFGHSLEIKPAG